MSSALCANCGYTVANDIQLPTTPVPDSLGGNYIASESQAQMVHDTISFARADILQLDGEIHRLQALLDELIRKRDALQTYTYLHVALVTPIGRLPPEILSEIFLHCKNEGLTKLQLNKAPLVLGSVCNRWRTIALSTPQLWASFALTIRSAYLKSDVVLATTWLARAGTCPLTIRLACRGYARGSTRGFMQPLMDVFLLHCERWYDIHLSLPIRMLGFLVPAKNRLPSLQKLYLDGELASTLDIFQFAPQLRWFQLALKASTIAPSMIKVPWNQIEDLDLGHCGVDEYLELLRAAPNLQKCVARLSNSRQRDSHSPVQHLHLRSMIIFGDPTQLFDTLLLPKLQEITIRASNIQSTVALQLTSFLSQCSLKTLSLNLRDPLSDYDMIQILKTCPSLVQLDLRGSSPRCMTASFFAQFAFRWDTENSIVQKLVPMLQTLTVDYTPRHFDIINFADAIQSRLISNGQGRASDDVTKLLTVELRDIRLGVVLDLPALSRLRQLKENGLEIRVLQGDKNVL